jgi:hypothetical protein
MSSRRLLAHAAHRKYDNNMADYREFFVLAQSCLTSGTIVSPTNAAGIIVFLDTVFSAPPSAMSSRRLLAYAAHRKYDINMADL